MRFNPYALANATAAPAAVEPSGLPPQPVAPASPEAPFLALYGKPGAAPVPVDDQHLALTLTLLHNDNAGQVDHYDPHAPLGCPAFLLLQARRGPHTEALARRALSLVPSLHRLDWQWRSENYRGGRGHYLASSGYPLPPDLRDAVARHTRKTFTGTTIEVGFWVIGFAAPARGDALRLWPHAVYGAAPLPETPLDRAPAFRTGPVTAECRLNPRFNGVEIHFSRRPDDAALAPLRAERAWRYTGFTKCWYARQTPETVAWAQAFVTQFNTPPNP